MSSCNILLCINKFLPMRKVKRRIVGNNNKYALVRPADNITYDPFWCKSSNIFIGQRKERWYSIYVHKELAKHNDEETFKNEYNDETRFLHEEINEDYRKYGEKVKDGCKKKMLNELILLKNKRLRDCQKLKLISKNIYKNISFYNLHEISDVLECTYFFSIILKKEDMHKLIKRLKVLTFNKKKDNVMYKIILNFLRIKIPREYEDKKLIATFNTFLNDLLSFWLVRPPSDIPMSNYLDYIYFVKETQLIVHNDFCSWFDKNYYDNLLLSFLQSFQYSIVRQNRNLDFLFIKEVIDILSKLNCQTDVLNMYNFTIPIFIKDFHLIVECIGNKNTFDGTSILIPYFSERYKLFKKLNFRVLLLYKHVLPHNEEDKLNFVKQALYDIIK
ncbi:hypothetical protein, conserved [Plasmodium gonderi]|uniref:Uncharacterized protein n=1 Tax=Plasmodium gonderi TaxID=77519 RepID=A0A1Y1JPP9_PLAGO|nr:hypothetical protein, conserved [Plasmodium gonderi]GAW82812.1 hypothetical protein, conserved [Plasmodium gonderi]